jgi:hypothetical protein
VLTGAVPLQGLESVAWRCPEVAQFRRGVQIAYSLKADGPLVNGWVRFAPKIGNNAERDAYLSIHYYYL